MSNHSVFFIVWSSDNPSWPGPEYASIDKLLNHKYQKSHYFLSSKQDKNWRYVTKLMYTEYDYVSVCLKVMYCKVDTELNFVLMWLS